MAICGCVWLCVFGGVCPDDDDDGDDDEDGGDDDDDVAVVCGVCGR